MPLTALRPTIGVGMMNLLLPKSWALLIGSLIHVGPKKGKTLNQGQ